MTAPGYYRDLGLAMQVNKQLEFHIAQQDTDLHSMRCRSCARSRTTGSLNFIAADPLAFVAKLLAIALTLYALVAAPVSSAQLRSDFDLGAQWTVNSTARLMAGMPPLHPAHIEFAQTDAWKEHAAAMRSAWGKVAEGRVAAMTAWRDSAISPNCPVNKTLLYPFSGPDFLNAWWLFPDCDTFVMFGLEHIGEVPNLEAMNERQIRNMIADVRTATTDLFDRNYFITENMARQLRTANLRGVVPIIMISMALSGVDILRLRPLDIATGPRPAEATGRTLRQLRGVTIEFRTAGGTAVKRLHYFTVDATNSSLARYPEFLELIRKLGPTTTFIKSASYLLHGREFSQLRTALLQVSGFLVQDDSGLPYAMLATRGWQVHLHGRYDVPIPPFERAYQSALYRAYSEQRPEPLPFTFGYQFHDYRDERSNVMVALRPSPTKRAAIEERIGKRVALRTSGWLAH